MFRCTAVEMQTYWKMLLKWCTPISPIAISSNQWFLVRVSHQVFIELVLADEMALGEMGMNRPNSAFPENPLVEFSVTT